MSASKGRIRLDNPTTTTNKATIVRSSVDKTELEALLARIDIWLLVFGIVVVVGVAGESFFGIRHWWNSRKLQAVQEKENLALQKEIEGLRKDNLELAKSIAPRILGISSAGGKSNIDGIKAFAGMQVIIEALPESEPQMAAGYIEQIVVSGAGWKLIPPVPRTGGIFPGVSIASYLPAPPGADWAEEQRCQAAASALTELLRENNWQVGTGIVSRAPQNALPPNTVRVLVGIQQAPVSLNPLWKAAHEEMLRGLSENREK
jgi:hypothetical protein